MSRLADLSRSTQYARWISKSGEHEDHPGQSPVTRNREAIKQWAQDRDQVFIYQEHMNDGKQSNFFRLDNPHREDG